jgi:hypothetical protein
MYAAVFFVSVLCCISGSPLNDSDDDKMKRLEKFVSDLQMVQQKQDVYIHNMEEKLQSQEQLLHSNQRQIQDLERNIAILRRKERYPNYTTKCHCDGEVDSKLVIKNTQGHVNENRTLVDENIISSRRERDLNRRISRTKRLLIPGQRTLMYI